jgi:hypothetical protein
MGLRAHLNRLGYSIRWLWIGLATMASVAGVEICAFFAPRRARADLYFRFAHRW